MLYKVKINCSNNDFKYTTSLTEDEVAPLINDVVHKGCIDFKEVSNMKLPFTLTIRSINFKPGVVEMIGDVN